MNGKVPFTVWRFQVQGGNKSNAVMKILALTIVATDSSDELIAQIIKYEQQYRSFQDVKHRGRSSVKPCMFPRVT